MAERSSVPHSPWRKLIFGFILVSAVPMLYLSASMMLAGIREAQTVMFLDDWSRRGEVASERAWQVARDAAEDAVSFSHSTNAELLMRLGKVNEWYRFDQPFGDASAEASRRAALEAYRSEVDIRPLWPYAWVQLAFIKLRLLEFDDEFFTALDKGYELGPGRTGVIGPLTEIGLIVWPQLDAGQRYRLWEGMGVLLAYDVRRFRSLLYLVDAAGAEDEMCRVLNSELLAKRKLCQ